MENATSQSIKDASNLELVRMTQWNSFFVINLLNFVRISKTLQLISYCWPVAFGLSLDSWYWYTFLPAVIC